MYQHLKNWLGVIKTFFLCYSQNLRLFDTTRFIWTDGLQVMFVLQRTGKVKVRYEIFSLPFFLWVKAACFVVAASVLYYYWYKRTSEYLGDPRLYEDSPWLREAYARVRQWCCFLLELEGLCQMPVRTILSHCSGGPNLSHRDTLTSCHFFILLTKYKFIKLFWKCLRFHDPLNHFVSLDSMCWFKYSKTFWPFMSESVFGQLILNPFHQVLFPEMTAADAAEAATSALRTLWAATPSAGWTVQQKEAEAFEGRADYLWLNDNCRMQTELTDFAILWKCSASFCLPNWKQMLRNKVSSGSRSLIGERTDG